MDHQILAAIHQQLGKLNGHTEHLIQSLETIGDRILSVEESKASKTGMFQIQSKVKRLEYITVVLLILAGEKVYELIKILLL